MPGTNSNISVTATIQTLDALGTNTGLGVPPLTQRTLTSVLVPSSTQQSYSGYQVINNTLTLFTALFVPFLFVRNANPANSQGVLIVRVKGVGAANTTDINLTPGGIFIYANSTSNLQNTPGTTLDTVQLIPSTVVVTVEYLWAY